MHDFYHIIIKQKQDKNKTLHELGTTVFSKNSNVNSISKRVKRTITKMMNSEQNSKRKVPYYIAKSKKLKHIKRIE